MSSAQSPAPVRMLPFRLESRFVGRVWGYRDLRPWYDRVAGEEPIGEVWLTGDDCRVASGPHAGQSLGDLFRQAPGELLGSAAIESGSPLLVKMIFAREKLSVQVHPDDRMARKYGDPRGKTECWYALAAEPGAKVAAGLRSGVTMDAVRAGIANDTLEESLNILDVEAGDMVFVDAGTVHAIWPGSILLEVQQNCDLTYRMYDYGRPRELHIEKSLEATRLETRAGKVKPVEQPGRTVLIDEDYFCVERIAVEDERPSASLPGAGEDVPGLAYLFAAAGAGRIEGEAVDLVDLPERGMVAVPASSPEFTVRNLGGLDLIRITPRWRK